MSEAVSKCQVSVRKRAKERVPKSLVGRAFAQEPAGSTRQFPIVKYPARHLDVYFVTKHRLKWIDLNNTGFARPEYRDLFQEILRKEKWEVVSRELDFTVADHRKIHTILSLADQQDFPEGGIVVSPTDYYRAYGITPRKTKRGKQYKGREVEAAKRSLFCGGGVNPVPIVYVPVDPHTGKKQYAVVAHRPLYSIVEIYPDMSPQDVEKLPENLRKYRRTRKVLWHIQLNRLLIRDHKSYYKYADRDFYNRLKGAVRRIRGPKAHMTKHHINCYLWLLRQEKLAVTLQADLVFADRVLKIAKNTIIKNPRYVCEKIQKIFSVLMVAGYLVDFRRVSLKNGEERWELRLNRDRFPSLRRKQASYASV